MNIGKAIVAFREKKGLKQVDLAERSGYTQAYISKLETGFTNPRLDVVNKIAQALEVQPLALFIECLEGNEIIDGNQAKFEELKPALLALLDLVESDN